MKILSQRLTVISGLLLVLCLSYSGFAEEGKEGWSTPDNAPASDGEKFPIEIAPGDPLQQKVSLDYKDADLNTVLRSLSHAYNINLVTNSDVKGKVTISLKDVTIQEALEVILSSNEMSYTVKGNIIYVNSSKVEEEKLTSVPIVLNYLKVAESQDLLRKVLSDKGDIKADEVSNLLIVTDHPENIEKLKELLKTVDQPPKQVLIEAKIVDITSQDLENLGVTWETDYNPGEGLFNRSTGFNERMTAVGTFAGPSSSVPTGQFQLDPITFKDFSVSATIDALVQKRKAHLLASPSIAVLNNREARIIIGEKVPFKERTQTTTGTSETTKFIDVGTTLRVTPSINSDGYITMLIHPEVSSVTSLLDAGPRITTREADTMVRVKEGETIVIGGLIKQEDNQTNSKVPLLGKIPLLGALFGNRSKDQTQTELAVFITPKILRSRDEMIALKKNSFEEEAYVNIMATGALNTQMVLFDKARMLEMNEGLESQNKEQWLRMSQALSLYESIVTQFPDGPKAAEAGYRAASIYYYDLGKSYMAKELCLKIISDYPKSPYAEKAKILFRKINTKIEKEAGSKMKSERSTSGKN